MKTLIRTNDSFLQVLVLTISFYSVPLDLDVKFKAILMGACFLVVSTHGIIGFFDCKQALHFECRGKGRHPRENARVSGVLLLAPKWRACLQATLPTAVKLGDL